VLENKTGEPALGLSTLRKGSGLIMKKTLVALAVLASGSASAVEVYNSDGIVTKISGTAEVQLIVNNGYKTVNEDLAVRIDDLDLTAETSIAIDDSWAALGVVSLDKETDNDGNTGTGSSDISEISGVDSDKLYVGFSHITAGTITFGQQTTISDDSGISADFEAANVTYNDNVDTDGTDVIKYVYDNGTFYAGVSYDLEERDSDESYLDGRIGYRANGFDVRLYAYADERDGSDKDGFNLEGEYSMDAWKFGLSYGRLDDVDTDDNDIDFVEAVVQYSMDDYTTFALGYAGEYQDGDNNDTNQYYFNVVNKLTKNVRLYAEIGVQDKDNETNADEDVIYLTGMEVKF
jgi:predicted porin